MCGCEICIQSGTYQESLNHFPKLRLRNINNHEKSLTRGSVQHLNAENIFSGYNDFLLPDGESICPRAKYASFFSMCDFPEKYIKLPKFSCVKLL